MSDPWLVGINLSVVFVLLLGGCGGQGSTVDRDSSSEHDDLTPVVIQLNWHPENEHGGVYQAWADGTYREAGLDVEIRPGGGGTNVAPELDLGRCQFAITGADDIVQFRENGSNVVAVLAAMQNHPRCLLMRADSGVESFEDLSGMTLQCQAGRGFLNFMDQRGLLDGVKQVPYHGSVSLMVSDPNVAIQAYSIAEPWLAKQQGVETTQLMVSKLGWNPYASVLVTTDLLIQDRSELVRRVVRATRHGWQSYLQDPTAGNEAILRANRHGMTAEALRFGVEAMRELALPDPMSEKELGKMTPDRWARLVQQIDGFEPGVALSVDPAECFDASFLSD